MNREPNQRNFARLGELSSEVGDHEGAATAFLKLAELMQSSGGDPAQWYERAYSEAPAISEVAMAYGRSLLAQNQVGAAIFVLEPRARSEAATLEIRDMYARALVAANRLVEAEPLVWQLFEQDPSRILEIANLIGAFIDGGLDAEAVGLAKKLEQFQRRTGDRRAFLATMQEIVAHHRPSSEVLEFMSELFNASNRESDYSQTLIKLFDLYCDMGDFNKAAEALDRAADVDAYEKGHEKRLELLRGKIDDTRFKAIAARFTSMSAPTPEPARSDGKTLGAAALQDLMLQAEILVQYGMRTKALERLQRIHELFPHEEERNPNLQQLYMTAGLNPRYPDAAPVVSAPVQKVRDEAPAVPTPPPLQSTLPDADSFTRAAEITRKLYSQTNSDAVLATAVSEIGTQWKLTRCVAAMRKPGLTPTSVKEFRADGGTGRDGALQQVLAELHDLAISQGVVTITNVQDMKELRSIRPALIEMGIGSLLVLPFSDGPDQVGLLLLMQDAPRNWTAHEIVVLRTLSEQIVIALNNAGLRRLVKNLSVTDERSGLLKRASYLDLLIAETRRAVQNNSALTVLLSGWASVELWCANLENKR
ncbi:MAG: GAF domain-containing protein [Acidobacteriales bacterium]|nr:GAF domain-containing protein [Terriglobales bacterium]